MEKLSCWSVCFLGLLACVSASSLVAPIPSDLWQPPQWVSTLAAEENCFYLESLPADPVFQGQTVFSTSTNATISLSAAKSLLQLTLKTTNVLYGNFQWPNNMTELQAGYYGNLTQYSYPYGENELSWNSYTCNTCYSCNGTGWLVVDSVRYTKGAVSALTLRFQYQCNNSTPPLSGWVSWAKTQVAYPAGPTVPPSPLWEPSSVPSTGNYVYLESQTGDILGGGLNYTYLSSDAQITFTYTEGDFPVTSSQFSVETRGWTSASGYFQLMAGQGKLVKGYYANQVVFNYALASVNWNGPAGWCNYNDQTIGWFVIDEVSYKGKQLSAVRMRFQVSCDSASAALYGALNWAASNPLNPPAPVYPPPADLWQPPKAAVPASGNYVYLEGQKGAVIYGPLNYTYTINETYFSAKWVPFLNTLFLNFTNEYWNSVELQPLYSMTLLERGYYANIQPPFGNPAMGRVGLISFNTSINNYTGWMAVDRIAYKGKDVTEFSVRFELVCANGNVLHGAVGWKASNLAGPQPVYPPPQYLWQPPASALPASPIFCYLEVEAGYLSQPAANYTYTPLNATLSSYFYPPNYLQVAVTGEQGWAGAFGGCQGLKDLKPGYYGGLGSNYNRGSINWSNGGSAYCSAEGWFVLDEIKVKGKEVKAVTLRFEQRCQGSHAAVRGMMKWRAGANLEIA